MTRGRFIVVEGIDGCGSSTQAKMLKDRLSEDGIETFLTCEPCQGLIGRMIRQNLRKELVDPRTLQPHSFGWDVSALLFAADRLDHIQTEVLPALKMGLWVISDRYLFSSLTYQSLTAGIPQDEALRWIQALNCLALVPDLVIIVNASAEIAASRRAKRGGSKELYEEDALQKALAEAYNKPQDYLIHKNYTLVNGDANDPKEVFKGVWATIQKARTEGFPDPNLGLNEVQKQLIISEGLRASQDGGAATLLGRRSGLSYAEIARALVPVEPLQTGAQPYYSKDPDSFEASKD